jgi:simple sugar transport system permease protein
MTEEETKTESAPTGNAALVPPRLRSAGLAGVGTSLLRLRELSVVLVAAGLFIYFMVSKPDVWLSLDNFGNVSDFVSAWTIIAAGEVMLLVCGEIDLSASMTYAMTPVIMMTVHNDGVSLVASLIIALLVATAIGLFNGAVTVYLGLPSFITTLGMLFLLHGITLEVSGSNPMAAPTGGNLVQALGGWRWSEILWAIAIAIAMQIVLTNTRWGAYTIATGANFLGASEAGIKVRQIKIRAFVVTAVFSGFAGILDGIHISQSYDPNGDPNLMFTAVAAAVIGGTALLGGSGTVIGAFFGACLLGILQDGFNVTGLSANTFIVVEGAAIILAMVLNTQLSRFRRGAKVA